MVSNLLVWAWLRLGTSNHVEVKGSKGGQRNHHVFSFSESNNFLSAKEWSWLRLGTGYDLVGNIIRTVDTQLIFHIYIAHSFCLTARNLLVAVKILISIFNGQNTIDT